jgi:hypothetical protein
VLRQLVSFAEIVYFLHRSNLYIMPKKGPAQSPAAEVAHAADQVQLAKADVTWSSTR